MITNPRAFQQEYVPSELYHREGAIEALTTTLKPLTDGVAGRDAFVFGHPGTGKTTLARYVVDLLQSEVEGITGAYVNAMSNSTRFNALHALARDAGVAADLRKQGSNPGQFIDRLTSIDGQVVAIVDEAHLLEDYSTLQVLWEQPRVTLLVVALDEERLFATFDQQLQSRFTAALTVTLDRYTTAELTTILRGRVDAGLRPGVIQEPVLAYIADLAAGDARTGIAILHRAVEYAVDHGRDKITEGIVDAVRADGYDDVVMNRVQSLATDKRLLYEIVLDAGTIEASTLHDRYESRAPSPVAKSTRRKYLTQLQEFNLIRGEGQGRGRTYHVAST